ncbi:MAG: hypothetical protein ACI81L_002010 [Verrucomicrobiales bacterium]|jgi:hypothetical protein
MTPSQPIEVGLVAWQRELSIALDDAADQHKPVLRCFKKSPAVPAANSSVQTFSLVRSSSKRSRTSLGAVVPEYLRLVEQENSDRLETAYIAQSCFWVGEMELAKIDGVVTTEAGFMEGLEVTAIQFDPWATSVVAPLVPRREPVCSSAHSRCWLAFESSCHTPSLLFGHGRNRGNTTT